MLSRVSRRPAPPNEEADPKLPCSPILLRSGELYHRI
jgi:hypothetical protein